MATPNPNPTIPEHIFISFSQDDRAIAEKIVDMLRRKDIPSWIDYSKLPPGTPDWEAEIREAIEKSFAVVVLASPQSRASKYVRGELNLAESKGRQIYPFWIGGTEWSDCIPLGMTYAQFIDGRGERAEKGSSELCQLLEQHIRSATPKHYLVTPLWRQIEWERGATNWMSRGTKKITRALPPPGFATIELTEEEARWESGGSAVFVRISDYSSIHSFLDDLYLSYLTDQFEPFTYGSSWTLEEESDYSAARLLVPWLWLLNRQSIFEMPSEWLHHNVLGDCGLLPATTWHVRKTDELKPRGLAVEDERIWQAIRRSPKAEYFLRHKQILLDQSIAEVGAAYRYRFVFSSHYFLGGKPLPGTAMVQSKKALPEDFIQHWLN